MARRRRRATARRRIRYHMDESARKWLYKTARAEFWRVAAWYDLDSLVQDGYVCYQLIRRRYPQALDRPHIMRLFQVTFRNHIHQLSRSVRDQRAEIVNSDLLETAQVACDNQNYLTLLAEAPPVIQRILLAISVADDGWQARFRPDGTRETTNEFLCRLAGIDPAKHDLHRFLLQYLHPAFD